MKRITQAGAAFLIMECFKQVYLIEAVYHGGYNVWYFPFQLCSMPIYLCLAAGLLSAGTRGNPATLLRRQLVNAMLCFLMDYGLLGGVLALLVHDGFTFPEHPLLTLHGYLWHIGMVALAVFIYREELCRRDGRTFLSGTAVYLVLAVMAVLINIALRRFGDCDMFYLSPYHPSTQPVFREIDRAVGRPIGMGIYVFATIFGASILHGAGRGIHRMHKERISQRRGFEK